MSAGNYILEIIIIAIIMQLNLKYSPNKRAFGNSGNISVCHFASFLFCLFYLWKLQVMAEMYLGHNFVTN